MKHECLDLRRKRRTLDLQAANRPFFRKGLFVCQSLCAALVLTLSLAVSSAEAATCENGGLKETGVDLGTRYVNPSRMEVFCLQWLGTAEIIATHVVAKFPDGTIHARDAAGAWVPWDLNTGSLPDTGIRVDGNQLLNIPVFTGEANTRGFPIEATVYRRMANGLLQFGSLDIFPTTGGGKD